MGKKSRKKRGGGAAGANQANKSSNPTTASQHPHPNHTAQTTTTQQQHHHNKHGEGHHHHHKLHGGPVYNLYHKHKKGAEINHNNENADQNPPNNTKEQEQNSDLHPKQPPKSDTLDNEKSTTAAAAVDDEPQETMVATETREDDFLEKLIEQTIQETMLQVTTTTESPQQENMDAKVSSSPKMTTMGSSPIASDDKTNDEDICESEDITKPLIATTPHDLESPTTQATEPMPETPTNDSETGGCCSSRTIGPDDETMIDVENNHNCSVDGGDDMIIGEDITTTTIQTRYVRLASDDQDGEPQDPAEERSLRSCCNVNLTQEQRDNWRCILALATLFETVTCILRFGLGLQSTRDTSQVAKLTFGLRIHHGYLGILLLVLIRRGGGCFQENGTTRRWLYRLGWALIVSDLCHHFLVLWPITGSPHFDLVYPS